MQTKTKTPRVYDLICPQCGDAFTYTAEGPGRVPKRCPECRERDPKGTDPRYVRSQDHRQKFVTRVTRADSDMLDFIIEELEVSQSEAIRTAVRVYYAILRQGKKA